LAPSGRPGRDTWPRRRLRRILEQLGEAFFCSATVTELGAVIGGDDHDFVAEMGEHPLLELGGEGVRPGEVEDQLHAGVGGVDVLAARARGAQRSSQSSTTPAATSSS
jgi:hypothetical protein